MTAKLAKMEKNNRTAVNAWGITVELTRADNASHHVKKKNNSKQLCGKVEP